MWWFSFPLYRQLLLVLRHYSKFILQPLLKTLENPNGMRRKLCMFVYSFICMYVFVLFCSSPISLSFSFFSSLNNLILCLTPRLSLICWVVCWFFEFMKVSSISTVEFYDSQIQPTHLLMLTCFAHIFFFSCVIMELYIGCVKMSKNECFWSEFHLKNSLVLCCNSWCLFAFLILDIKWICEWRSIIKLPKWIRRWTSKKHLRWKLSQTSKSFCMFGMVDGTFVEEQHKMAMNSKRKLRNCGKWRCWLRRFLYSVLCLIYRVFVCYHFHSLWLSSSLFLSFSLSVWRGCCKRLQTFQAWNHWYGFWLCHHCWILPFTARPYISLKFVQHWTIKRYH